MIVYKATKADFIKHVDNDEISIAIERAYNRRIGKVKNSEKRAWKNSMLYMYKALNIPQIPDDATVAIEYRIPATSMRIDFILAGLDKSDKKNVVIIELKQWEEIDEVPDEDGIVKTFINKGKVRTTHPSYQAWTYSCAIEDYNEGVEKNKIALHPCAYFHNYVKRENDPLTSQIYSNYLEKAPVYTQGEVIKLREFIARYVYKGDNEKALYDIEGGRIRPSKSLQDALKLMLDGNEEFKLMDNQKVVFEKIRKTVFKKMLSGKKNVFIIKGGPGTGKSVLAINLLVKLNSAGYVTQYVSKNSAPREVYQVKLKGNYTQKYIGSLFKGSGCFIDSQKDEIDVLLVDEAHRLNEKSGIFKNKGENQIKEIINSAKLSVFFIDEEQRVTLSDIGSIDEIRRLAKEAGANVIEDELTAQFRCNGSDGYLNWIDDVLELKNTANFDGFDFDYEIEVVDNPSEMREKILEKNKVNNKARLLAGYCWDWISKGNYNNYDIVFPEYNFKMKWNLTSKEPWAIGKNSVNEIGCIHTCQGLEFDYVGVIIGEDLRYENNRVISDFSKRAKTDQSLKGIKKLYKNDKEKALEKADEIIKNTYRVLMTRGMKGCYIYCVDKELQKYIKDRINNMTKNIGYKEIDYLYQENLINR
ncbi:DNA/RNA helicase domain-containing protein [Clostridium paraputrificum]|uniref:DNA/RNA helicase domain-containing protein n=1 Tax=Clostridium paraputrificum TaxID=29363 RepID=UPI003D34391C